VSREVSSRDRCHQVHRWLQDKFRLPRGTRLRVVRRMPKEHGDKCDGVIIFDKSPALIWVNANRSRSTMIYTVLHEYAHAILEDRHRDWKSLEHSDPWYRVLGIVERRYFDGGEKESRAYRVR